MSDGHPIHISSGTGALSAQNPVSRPGDNGSQWGSNNGTLVIDTARVGPTGPAFTPRRWGALACAFLGIPVTGS